MTEQILAECNNCGHTYEIESAKTPSACPKCASNSIKYRKNVGGGTLEMLTLLGIKKKSSSSSRKRPDKEVKTGNRIGKDGKKVHIERTIDRDSNRYQEYVISENGQLIVDKDEKLSDHK